MYESYFQSEVSNEIINQETDNLVAGLTENELAVVVRIEGTEAAYTADEARHLADGIDQASRQQNWEVDTESIVAFLRDLADVVDNDKEVDEVKKKWENKNTQNHE